MSSPIRGALVVLRKKSPCKVNLLLNILGRRDDGFHELETVMQPIRLYDELRFERAEHGIELTCDQPSLPTGQDNLIYRAAVHFFEIARLTGGVRIHLEKRIPVAAGLGGGSGDAATALLGLNEVFDFPLTPAQLQSAAASLGSDIPFFLQDKPALATGRGEHIHALHPFPALKGMYIVLVYPGFGVPTAWAYQNLAPFPDAMNGTPGRARLLVDCLMGGNLSASTDCFYNALELPVFRKYPLLPMVREHLAREGARVARMSGSGSTIFALADNSEAAERLRVKVKDRFGPMWVAVIPA